MKIYKPLLALSFILGSYGVSVYEQRLIRSLKKFACQVGIASRAVTVFTSDLSKSTPQADARSRTCQFAKSCSPTGLCPTFSA